MELVPEENFAYSRLDKETKTIVRQRALEIKNLMRLTADNIIKIGQKLTEVKEKLGHGNFQSWLRSEFEWSEQTARQFMQVYRWSETIENKNFVFSQLATSALYLLAAPSTPTKAREEVLNLVDGEDKVSYSLVKDIVERHKNELYNHSKSIDPAKVRVEEQAEKLNGVSIYLFRLATPQLGCIVRLYRVEELEAITSLTLGSTVKIKVGRWQGQTAEIIEILQDKRSPISEPEPMQPLSPTQHPQNNFTVRIVDEVDLFNREKLRSINQDLIISYGSTCLAIEGDRLTLATFVEQIKTNPTFAQSVFSLSFKPKHPEI